MIGALYIFGMASHRVRPRFVVAAPDVGDASARMGVGPRRLVQIDGRRMPQVRAVALSEPGVVFSVHSGQEPTFRRLGVAPFSPAP